MLFFCRSVMKSRRSALLILILMIITTLITDAPTVIAPLRGSAVLPCSVICSGVVRWTVFRKRSDVLAECDQTSCRSVKEGYQMIYNQYLQGNLSLIITEADYSKRDWYTCECDGRDICDVRLQIEPLNSTVQKISGDSLVMRLDVSDPVQVIYNSSTGAAAGSSDQICTVDGESLQCKPEYKHRTSLLSVLELRGVNESDSGVYTVIDTINKEVIHIYTVTVTDVQQSWIWKDGYERGYRDGYRTGLAAGGAGFGISFLVLGFIFGWCAWSRRIHFSRN
ncbi:uncharacterized protein LOC111190093 [Astyanax mexicanus]|uniref:uncharacterized protein LOC111190093 n=1 Tax=Astyanax mexicanus TaxID=7994 RepID=UPI0020CB26FB|nr:uncharacterized protein LOC111190093 [Astyanax mexicanus]